MVKNAEEVSIRIFDKTDWMRFALNSDDDLRNDPFYPIAFSTLRELSQVDADNLRVEKCYTAVYGDTILGFIYGFVLPNRLLIPEFVYVKPDYRKKGIAKELLVKLEKESACETSMIFYNKELRGHYQRLGYTVGDNLEVALKELNVDNSNRQE